MSVLEFPRNPHEFSPRVRLAFESTEDIERFYSAARPALDDLTAQRLGHLVNTLTAMKGRPVQEVIARLAAGEEIEGGLMHKQPASFDLPETLVPRVYDAVSVALGRAVISAHETRDTSGPTITYIESLTRVGAEVAAHFDPNSPAI